MNKLLLKVKLPDAYIFKKIVNKEKHGIPNNV